MQHHHIWEYVCNERGDESFHKQKGGYASRTVANTFKFNRDMVKGCVNEDCTVKRTHRSKEGSAQ